MKFTIRLWPFWCWLHAGCWSVWSQGGRWEDKSPRHVTDGFTVRLGVTWSNRKTYRTDNPNYPAHYLIFGDGE